MKLGSSASLKVMMMSKPRFPKSTKISGTKWRVVPRRQVVLEGEEVEGACHFDHHMLEITVESECEYTILRNFWHELMHGIFYEAGVELEGNVEHALINNIEKYLATNVDFRQRPRKPKKRAAMKQELVQPPLKKKKRRGAK